MILRFLSNLYYVTNIFDLHICDNEMAALLIFLKICTDMHLFLYFFRNERNITTSLLMINLKCTVVHYTNLNWSSKTKLPVAEYAILFFTIFYLFILMKLLSIYLWNNYSFQYKFPNLFITQSPLLISDIVTSAGQFLATKSPWKIMKNFLFQLNKLNMLLANQILHILCIFIKPNV